VKNGYRKEEEVRIEAEGSMADEVLTRNFWVSASCVHTRKRGQKGDHIDLKPK
jgi:hypothetical protein